MDDSVLMKRPWDDSEAESADIDSLEVKRLRENLLQDDEAECCAEVEDLDSYMRSFEEEIRTSPAAVGGTSFSGENQPVLGYLLEASDDDLGLPPTNSSSPDRAELLRAESNSSELANEIWGFDGEISGYDQLGFGAGEAEEGGGGEFGVFDALFEFSDFGSGDFAWRSETPGQ
ncbi:hypothetical protein F511_44443 [Dorcoceras hygrometricum]|uniref:Uncharacterized protein n=1 Tax=Dorcoceras hygrometricum TaxID=472368 RepID=A0A2Z7A5L3_9LAMI|nr:hypothetical protein F511_44443 [Dorcoceras hygrometricum]